MEKIFFDSWQNLVRIMVIGVGAYIGLVFILRFIGNRTLSQLNAFDLIVTIALGSTLATVILNKEVPLIDGFLALILLIVLEWSISSLSVRYKAFRYLIKTEPLLLFFHGKYLQEALKKHRITEDEILQIMRSEGIGSTEEIDAVVLETNGQFSVIKKATNKQNSTLENVQGHGVKSQK